MADRTIGGKYVSEQATIVDLADAEAADVLEPQRRWAAYALCDLEQPHRQYARFIGAVHGERTSAVVLVYAPPSFTSLLPCGEEDDVAAILAEARDLPQAPLLIVQRANRRAVETRYNIERAWTMLRMIVTADTLRVPLPARENAVPLGLDDLPALQRLYAGWTDTVFSPLMFEHGTYFGIYRGSDLAAAAGTHAVSKRYSIGVIGNVYTHPEHRSSGLATAVTGAVATSLIAQGARDVALNVREDNAPAIAVYSTLGFSVEEPFWECTATLR